VELARLVQADPEDPTARRARLIADGAALETRTRAECRVRPADLEGFEETLAAAKACGALSEEHNYWIDRLCQANGRRFILRVADVLVGAGAIETRDDIFHLHIAEIRDSLATGIDRRALLHERKAQFEHD